MTLELDHIALGTADLQQGVSYLKNILGVEVPQGGKHPLMGTHNHVMRTGIHEFFELIAIDQEAPTPSRTRWFSLDDPNTKAHIAERPRALCWVVRTNDIDALVKKSSLDLGEAITVTRGDLKWRLTVPQDGSLGEGGLIPAFIQWPEGMHPAESQQDLGVKIKKIILTHPKPAILQKQLDMLEISYLADVQKGTRSLSFELQTPKGLVTID